MRQLDIERQQRAIAAALVVARRYGIACDRPTILHDSNHTVIHLAPAPLVAKVGTSPEETSLEDEIAVASFLASKNAEIVPPTSLFPPGPHGEAGLEMTFWEYCPHSPVEPSADVLARSLRDLHDALSNFPSPLRRWDRFDGVERVFQDPGALASLPRDDRTFLQRSYESLLLAIAGFRYRSRPLHGEPHGANLLLSPQGPRWIDFESACLGPQEWDLTVLPDEFVARYFEDADLDLLQVLKRMRSLCVAVWCWRDPGRAPVLREAGTYHLALLHRAAP